MPDKGRSAWLKVAALALPVFVLDVGTKHLVSTSYLLGEHGHFLFVSTYYLQNPGESLGLFTQLGLIDSGVHVPVLFFAAMSAVGCVGIYLRTADSIFFWLPAGLVLGGGLGNVLERVYHGYGTDFIMVPGIGGSGNVADFAIFSGLIFFFLADVGGLLWAMCRKSRAALTGSAM